MMPVTKYCLRFLVLTLVLLGGVSCSKERKDPSVTKSVLLYMAANNNLSTNAIRDLADLKKGYVPDFFPAGGTGDVLLVYYHISKDTPKLLRISKDEFGIVNQEILKEYDQHNSCTDSVFHSVLTYANSLFPAQENGLILWSHGTGWLPKGYYSNPTSLSEMQQTSIIDPDEHLVKSFGAENGEEMSIISLANNLPIKYSYIIFDACLMGGIEVAYQLKDKCSYLVFSPTEILTDGFPYSDLMEDIYSTTKADLKEVCLSFYNYYQYQTDSSRQSASISLIKTSELDYLAQATKKIFDNGGRTKISKLSMSDIQPYFRTFHHWYYDLEDFMKNISSSEDYRTFEYALDEAVIYKEATPYFLYKTSTGFEIKTFSGLSTYIPNPENATLDSFYKSLSWNNAVRMIQ